MPGDPNGCRLSLKLAQRARRKDMRQNFTAMAESWAENHPHFREVHRQFDRSCDQAFRRHGQAPSTPLLQDLQHKQPGYTVLECAPLEPRPSAMLEGRVAESGVMPDACEAQRVSCRGSAPSSQDLHDSTF